MISLEEQDRAAASARYFTASQIEAFVQGAAHARAPGGILRTGDLKILFNPIQVYKAGELLRITNTEAKLLNVLLSQPGIMISNEELLHKAWGPEYIGDTQYLRVWISRLRTRMGSQYFKTTTGRGYTFILLDPIEEPNDQTEDH